MGHQPGQQFVLSGPEARHAVTVRRLGPGQWLDVVDGEGVRVRAQVVSADTQRLVLAVQEVHRTEAPSVRLMLVQALAKADRDLQAVESCTELGVDDVVAWQADRSVARFREGRKQKQLDKWRNTITAAAKQSRRSRWPVLWDPVDTAGLTNLMASSPQTFWVVLHEKAEQTLIGLFQQHQDVSVGSEVSRVALVVGPEGGISDAEIDQLTARGARTALLGPDVLRSSTAGPAGMVLVNMFTGRWNSTPH